MDMSSVTALLFRFFFFQAEDGIRDWSVTGVQTCALPILKFRRINVAFVPGRAAYLDGRGASSMRLNFSAVSDVDIREGVRSEERRVGKECRSRWSPCQ